MKILIIGEWYSSNLGDGIICENVRNILGNEFEKENVELYVADISCRNNFMIEKDIISKVPSQSYLKNLLHKSEYLTYKVQQIKRKRTQKIKEVCLSQKYDYAIFAGGCIIMPYFVFQLCDFVKYLSLNGTKIIFNACGVGEIKSKILIKKIQRMFKNENIIQISSRDNVEKLENKYVNNRNVVKTYDPAIYTNETYDICKNENSEIIGLGIMKLSNVKDEKIIDFWSKIIKELDNKGEKWQLFCNGGIEDYNLACECLKKVDIQEDEKYLARRPTTPKELVELIATYKSLISFRLHSHIVSYSLDIPTVAVVWNEKVKFFFKDLNFEDRCFYIDSEIDKIVNKVIDIEKVTYDKNLKMKQKKVIKENLWNKTLLNK